jgi:hypothetical protein
MRALPTCLTAVLLAACNQSQPEGGAMADARYLPEKLGDWNRAGEIQRYDREGIYKYIDGAGEVYNSYAFREVGVARYARPGRPELTVELFDMGNTYDAYGVFSYARETEETGIGGGYEMRGSVLCFWQDRYYICLTLDSASAQSESLLKSLARAMAEKLPTESEPPPLIGSLPSEGLVPFSQHYFHLHASLIYHYYVSRENILNLNATTKAVLARYRPGSTLLLLVEYPDESAAATAAGSFRQAFLPEARGGVAVETDRGKFAAAEQVNRYLAVVFDAESAPAADSLIGAVRANL